MEDILEGDKGDNQDNPEGKKSKFKKVDLTYKASCAELNELQLTFNKVAKTINITNKTVKEGEEYRAMLDYAEAYHIFNDFEN